MKNFERLESDKQDWEERLRKINMFNELLEACKVSLHELRHAPCRDNEKHTFCLKCKTVEMLEAVIEKAEKK